MSSLSVAAREPIRPYPPNPFYWQYHGRPVVLMGGSDTDNLFQWTGKKLTDHLDLLVRVGGNYVRNTMSSRAHAFPYDDTGMAYPFKKRTDGRYDLEQWEPEYWKRLDTFLAETQKRGIIVQLELWDAYAVTGPEAWAKQPWNPANNVNYTYKNTTLDPRLKGFKSTFFLTVPALNNDKVVLRFQTRYVEKMLSISLRYDNVLYQIDNESAFPFEVSDFWAKFIHTQARALGRTAYVCDSRRFHPPSPVFKNFRDLHNPEISHPLSHPELYNYIDISQNCGNVGQTQYDNLLWLRSQLSKRPRPINHTKIYQFAWATGLDWRARGPGSEQEAGHKFWRAVFGGAASARHHRHDPKEGSAGAAGGLGLSPFGQVQIRSMHMLLAAMRIFTMVPSNDLLSERETDEAYLLAEPGRQYAVYFTGKGDHSVRLDLRDAPGLFLARWLDVDACSWDSEREIRGAALRTLAAPDDGPWVALLVQRNSG